MTELDLQRTERDGGDGFVARDLEQSLPTKGRVQLATTLGQLLPFAIAGAFLPTWTTYVTLMLGTDRPLGTSTAYVLGNATWRFSLGFVTLFVVKVAAPETQNEGIVVPVLLAATLSAVLIAMGVWLIRRQPRADRQSGDAAPRWLKAIRRLPPWVTFGYGIWNCALPGAQWVYFLGGIAVISASGFEWEWQLVTLVAFIAFLEVMLVTPIVIYAWRREKAAAAFDKLDSWLGEHASMVFGAILTLIGAAFALVALNGGRIGGG